MQCMGASVSSTQAKSPKSAEGIYSRTLQGVRMLCLHIGAKQDQLRKVLTPVLLLYLFPSGAKNICKVQAAGHDTVTDHTLLLMHCMDTRHRTLVECERKAVCLDWICFKRHADG